MEQNQMLTGRPGKTLFFFALPMIVGNLFQQFYNMVDSIIVGRYLGAEALAAVGASYSFSNVFIMIAIGGGIGASVLTSQYLGAEDYGKMRTSAYTALISFLVISVCLAAFGTFFNPSLMRALNTPEDVFGDAMLYLQIYFMGLPFLFMYNVLSATFNALGKSRIPLYFLIFSSVLNVVLDVWMVRGLGFGIAGVAIATVIAQGVSAVLSFFVLLKELGRYPKAENGEAKIFAPIMLLKGTCFAIPSIVQQSIVSIGMLLVQSVVNGFGTFVMAGYAAGSRVESICIVPMIATGNAAATFTAQNLGARQPERVRQGLKSAFMMIAGFGALICLSLNLFHNQIISAFINPSSVQAFATGNAYLAFISWFFVMIGFKAATDGVLKGSGDVIVYTLANLANLYIRVAVAKNYAPLWGVQAVWYAVPIGWTVNFLLSFSWYMTGRWSRKRVVS